MSTASNCSKHLWEPRGSLIKQSVGQCCISLLSWLQPRVFILLLCMEKHTSWVKSVFFYWCVSINRTSHKSPRTLEVLLLQCHYVKVFEVDRDYSFYCAFMSPLLAAGQNKPVSLIWENQRRYARRQNDVCATVLSSNPLCLGLFTANKAAQDDGETGLHLQDGEGHHPQHCATKLEQINMRTWLFRADTFSLCPSIQQLYPFHFPSSRFFPFVSSLSLSATSIWVCSLSFPPPAPPVSTSHFLFPPVNINTGLMCTPAQMSALEELTAPIIF